MEPQGDRQMKVFQVDIKVAATAYITANSEEEAQALYAENFAKWNDEILPDGGIVSGAPFEVLIEYAKLDGPFVSISPAITCHGHWGGLGDGPAELELAYEEEEGENAE